jgi:hypothetical protein
MTNEALATKAAVNAAIQLERQRIQQLLRGMADERAYRARHSDGTMATLAQTAAASALRQAANQIWK